MRTRGHRLSVTSAVASDDAKNFFTAGKEGSIIKWDLSSGKNTAVFYKIRPETSKGKGKEKVDVEGHTDEVLALALSSDGKYLASGGKDRRVGIWDAGKGVWVKGFMGHKDTISVSLGFLLLSNLLILYRPLLSERGHSNCTVGPLTVR